MDTRILKLLLMLVACTAVACSAARSPDDPGANARQIQTPLNGIASVVECTNQTVTNLASGREVVHVAPLAEGPNEVVIDAPPAGDVRLTAYTTAQYADGECVGPVTAIADPLEFRIEPGASRRVSQRFVFVGQDLVIDSDFEDLYLDTEPVEAFQTVGELSQARTSHQATSIPDANLVLISGGTGSSMTHSALEWFDASTDEWTLEGSSVEPRYDHEATYIGDGRVLVTGGVASNVCSQNSSAELADASTRTSTPVPNAPIPLSTGHFAVRLLDGRVLVGGGGNRCGTMFATAAIYDPVADSWATTGSLGTARQFASAALLSDGRVLVAGGQSSLSPHGAIAASEVWEPSTGAWSQTASMSVARQTSCNGYTGTFLAPLLDGAVLATAAARATNCLGGQAYDPTPGADVFNSDNWAEVAPMQATRYFASVTSLENGDVLVAGGVDGTAALASAELYEATSNTWRSVGSLNSPRAVHRGTLLTDGRVLITGGGSALTEVYVP